MSIKDIGIGLLISFGIIIISIIYIYQDVILKTISYTIVCAIFISILILIWAIFFSIYQFKYYRSIEFQIIEASIKNYVQDCNDLNDYIKELKEKHKDKIMSIEGFNLKRDIVGLSGYKFKKAKYEGYKFTDHDYNCSVNVLKNAERNPYKSLCKYFTVKENEESLSMIEEMLNDFTSLEEGKLMLESKFTAIKKNNQSKVPLLISIFGMKKFMSKVGINKFIFTSEYYPICKFISITEGKRKMKQVVIPLDVEHLNQFVQYLSERIKFKKSKEGQRALMTSKLRKEIKERDNYTCQNKECRVSIYDEPTLLLEIDHIKAIAKGGLTTKDNLQTLCWRCNRSKSTKTSRMFLMQYGQIIPEDENIYNSENQDIHNPENKTNNENEDELVTT